ncbi:hypothetical protein Scep_030353 [Stephania cephalantha]|uniref:Uncharacterized protein n=1 Tax=Stephania cephalantha TaxID=152367 RepID=A0AAP0E3X2_9MAGN
MVTESDLPHLSYLLCVVWETFRIHPVGPFLIPHKSTKPTIINGYHIPGGTHVFINTHGLGRNRRVWDNVEEFLPERHLLTATSSGTRGRVEISHGADFKILSSSAGKMKCPRAPLGVAFVLTALARLFHYFYWAPLHDGIDTKEVYGMSMRKAKPLVVVATPRLATHMLHRLSTSRYVHNICMSLSLNMYAGNHAIDSSYPHNYGRFEDSHYYNVKPEKPQIESEEDQPLVLVQPPTLSCIFGTPYKGVEVKERSQIFYTAAHFVLDDPDVTDAFVLEVPNELLNLKEGVHLIKGWK